MSTHEKEWNVWIYGLTQEKYWNSEHFDDPTAGKAIARVMAEQRRKEQRRKELKLAEQRMAEKASGKAAQEAATESTGKTARRARWQLCYVNPSIAVSDAPSDAEPDAESNVAMEQKG